MKKIDAIEMVRNIRDMQNKAISGKSTQEVIEYFRRRAGEVSKEKQTAELNED